MEQAGRTMSALSTPMAAKHSKPHNDNNEEKATLTFLAEELDAIRSVRLRKQIQLALQQTVLAQLAEEDQE